MDGILNSKIETWITTFCDGQTEYNGLHINEIFRCDCPKRDWFRRGFCVFSLAQKTIEQLEKECYIMLCVELNVTKKARPFPHNLDSRLFINTETPPELIVCKHKPQNYFVTDTEYLPYLSNKYKMSVYGTRCSDDVSWRWLLFV